MSIHAYGSSVITAFKMEKTCLELILNVQLDGVSFSLAYVVPAVCLTERFERNS